MINNIGLLKLYFDELKNSFNEKAANLHSRIREKNDSSIESFNAIYTGLSLFLNINDNQIEKAITDGKDDCSIDAIYIPNSENIYKNVTIFDFKIGGNLNYEDIKKFIGYVEKYILDGNDLPRKGNNELLERLRELHDYITENPTVKIDIVIYREKFNNNAQTIAEENRLQYLKSKFDKVGNIKVLGYKEILDLVAKKLWYEGNIYANNFNEFNLNYDKNEIIKIDNDIIIGVVNLFNLLNFINKIELYNLSCNSNNRKYDVFKLNVRKKTDKSKPIREGIINTVENTPDRFLSYNNGITITCENFKLDNLYINFEQPQIVNGCQTISGLYDNFKDSITEYTNIIEGKDSNYKNKEDVINCIRHIQKLKKAKIYVKIVIAEQLSEEPKNISHYANSQTVVTPIDLVSNNLEQLIISNYLRLNGFNYFRKEGEEFEKGKQVISLQQIYKFMYGYALLDPSKGKNDLKNIFEEEIYEKLFPGIFNVTDILKIATLYRSVNDFIKKNNTSKYYTDFIVFGLFLLFKEKDTKNNIRPNTIKLLLDSALEKRSGKKIGDIDNFDFMRFFQRMPGSLTDLFISNLETKFDFSLDRNKFKDFINSFRSKQIVERNELMKIFIRYKGYNLDLLNQYKEDKEKEGKKLKAMKWVIKDIVKDNPEIIKDDIFEILKRFYTKYWSEEYLGSDKFIEDFNSSLSDTEVFYIKDSKVDLTFKN